MQKFRTQLDGHIRGALEGKDPAPDAILRFENRDVPSSRNQVRRGGKPCRAGSDDENRVLCHSTISLGAAEKTN
jgi:hypothetical protein